MKQVGVLCLQGDFERHGRALEQAGAKVSYIRTPQELEPVDAVVLPGGESTTIGKLMNRFELIEPLRERILAGMPVFGTCAGLILLAKQNDEPHQFRLSVLDIDVVRNAYGRQVESFEADFPIEDIGGDNFRGVFIRAPQITRIGADVTVLASFEEQPVLIRSGSILGGSFHPELTGDYRIHEYFLRM